MSLDFKEVLDLRIAVQEKIKNDPEVSSEALIRDAIICSNTALAGSTPRSCLIEAIALLTVAVDLNDYERHTPHHKIKALLVNGTKHGEIVEVSPEISMHLADDSKEIYTRHSHTEKDGHYYLVLVLELSLVSVHLISIEENIAHAKSKMKLGVSA
jgi:hypothetical protein